MSIKITWYSHACFIIESNGTKIITDPFISGNKLAPIHQNSIKADYICITHGHGDHVGDTVEIAKKNNSMVIANPEICNWLQKHGVKNLHAMQLGGSYSFSWGKLKMVYAGHSSPTPDGAYGGNPGGYIVTIENKKIYHAGDTGLFNDMKLIGEGKIDLALLPIGDNFTMGPEDALKALSFINPGKVIPMHYNTFDLIKQDPTPWITQVNNLKLSEAILLNPGESCSI
jgi:L-ascorbate metabolism protein UlaG (beta-lactamase superfamily)